MLLISAGLYSYLLFHSWYWFVFFILFFNYNCNLFIYLFNFYFILLYNTVLVLPYIDMNPPRVYTSSQSWIPLPPTTLYHHSGSSPCTSPKHPVSCIEHRLVIRFLHDSIHVSMPFSQITPPSPSPTESKSPFYTSVSLLLSHIQYYEPGLVLKIKLLQTPSCFQKNLWKEYPF